MDHLLSSFNAIWFDSSYSAVPWARACGNHPRFQCHLVRFKLFRWEGVSLISWLTRTFQCHLVRFKLFRSKSLASSMAQLSKKFQCHLVRFKLFRNWNSRLIKEVCGFQCHLVRFKLFRCVQNVKRQGVQPLFQCHLVRFKLFRLL